MNNIKKNLKNLLWYYSFLTVQRKEVKKEKTPTCILSHHIESEIALISTATSTAEVCKKCFLTKKFYDIHLNVCVSQEETEISHREAEETFSRC